MKALKVQCNNLQNGCLWTGELGSVEEHHEKCDFAIVSCENNGCNCTNLQRRDLLEHMENECPKCLYECPDCGKQDCYDIQTTSHVDICEMAVVQCPNDRCKESVLRKNIARHRDECEYEVTPCKYARLGCKEEKIRKEIKKHEEDAKRYLKSTQDKVVELMETVERQGKVIEEQAKVIERLSPLTKHVCSQNQPFIFRLSNCTSFHTDKKTFYSPPFYSTGHKYKFAIKINLEKLTPTPELNMRVTIDSQSILLSSFAGTITVMLLNQREDYNHKKYNPTFSGGFGYQSDIPLSTTQGVSPHSTQYFRNDTMIFKATIEERNYKSWLV